MIRTLDGDQILQGEFGTLLAVNVATMLYRIEKLPRGNKNVEFGVPFFDDLDFYPKIIAFHDVAVSLFERKMPPLPANAFYDSTLTAICRDICDSVESEIKMKHWSRNKFGEENRFFRMLVRDAFRTRYPNHALNVVFDWDDTTLFAMMSKRLIGEIMPEQYFLLADVEMKKRTTLMQRLGIPDDYFEIPFKIEPMSKAAMRRDCETILMKVLDIVMPFLFGKSGKMPMELLQEAAQAKQ